MKNLITKIISLKTWYSVFLGTMIYTNIDRGGSVEVTLGFAVIIMALLFAREFTKIANIYLNYKNGEKVE